MPPGAGVGSAIGFLRAPFGFEAVRSAYVRLSRFDADEVNRVLHTLRQEADSFVAAGLKSGEEPIRERWAYMRYAGQGWEIPVAVPDATFSASDGERFKAMFEQVYTQFFGRPIEDLDIEIVSWSLRATSPLPPVEQVEMCSVSDPVTASQTRQRAM